VGNQTLKQDPRGNRITMVYDAGNQLVGHRYPDGRRHTFTYDQVGNRTVLADPTGRTTTVYDDRNRPVRVTNPDDKAITYSYDAIGRRRTMVDPDDGVFTYTHDAAGRLHWMQNPQGQRTTFTYDGVGRHTQKDLAGGTVAKHSYFESGRLKVLLNSTSTGTIISSFTYTYDPSGNRTSVLESDGTGVAWRYDKTYQLVKEPRGTPTTTLTWDRLTADQWAAMTPDEWATMAATLQVDGSVYNTTYTYDPVGNRLVKEDSGAPTTYTYDAASELLTEEESSGVTTYTYDECGNRDTKETPSEITYYTWNEDNRMTEAEPVAGPVTFTYDAAGKRVGKQTSTDTKKFIYDFENLLQETDGSDTAQHEYTTTVEEYGDLVSEYDGTATSYHHYDALGSTDALTDPAQTSTDTWVYRAFGEVQSRTGTTDTPHSFVGRQRYYWDPEIDLYLLGAQTPYDPSTGRFVREDEVDADPNRYRYVGNNPVNAADPSGLQGCLMLSESPGITYKDYFKYIGCPAKPKVPRPAAKPQNCERIPWIERRKRLTEEELERLGRELRALERAASGTFVPLESGGAARCCVRAQEAKQSIAPVCEVAKHVGEYLKHALLSLAVGLSALGAGILAIVYGLPALAAACTVGAYAAIVLGTVMALVGVVYTLWELWSFGSERYQRGETWCQIILGALGDVTGISQLGAASCDTDIATGEHVVMCPKERGQAVGEGLTRLIAAIIALVSLARWGIRRLRFPSRRRMARLMRRAEKVHAVLDPIAQKQRTTAASKQMVVTSSVEVRVT